MNVNKVKGCFIAFTLFTTTLLFTSVTSSIADDYEGDGDDADADESLPYVKIKTTTDYSVLSKKAYATDQLIMLEVTANYCGYCELLEEEIIKPMLRSGDYTNKILIRQLEVDGYYTVIDFSGQKSTPNQLSKKYKIQITPTLLFLNSDGDEVAERILGINSLDFFGGYVDNAIDTGIQKIR